MSTLLVLLAGATAVVVAAGYLAWRGFVTVPAGHVGIVVRRFGPVDRHLRHVVPDGARGIQARTLLEGRMWWLPPGLYSVEFVPRVYVSEHQVGVVIALVGELRPPGAPLARRVECDHFQDGQAFLLNGGQQGPQVEILPGGASYYINTRMFEVEMVPRTHVPAGTVGLVIARAGRVRPTDQPFARHVECDSFQDGQAFLEHGGEQGRQLAVLGGGAVYDINPRLFTVLTADTIADADDGLSAEHLREIEIPPGFAGVVVTLDGADPQRSGEAEVGPTVPGHRNFRLPWVFLEQGGVRGVQEEILGEGRVYALNPWFVRVVLVPIRVLIVEWRDRSQDEADMYDSELDQITLTVEKHRLRLGLSQTLRITPSAAPRLVSAYGGASGLGGLVDDTLPVRRFVDTVLGATVASFFSHLAATSTIQDIIAGYAEMKSQLASTIENALSAWGVEALQTTLGELSTEDPALTEAFQELARRALEGKIDEVRVRAERRRAALEVESEAAELGLDMSEAMAIIRRLSELPVPTTVRDLSSLENALPVPQLRELLQQLRALRMSQDVPEGHDEHEG
ncbi:SPFH domain-containing protein [Nonomuraea sp. NPDC049400]|uniref:SPFH domain-containing protein n=1 Tax=Nonomuraea sp. NPDC049400 TaxID=3364352 RepID=UPI003795E95C